jgi:hypothetical protein
VSLARVFSVIFRRALVQTSDTRLVPAGGLPGTTHRRPTACDVGLGRLRAGSAAAPVSDGGYRFSLAKPGTSREGLIESVRAQRLAHLDHKLGLALP